VAEIDFGERTTVNEPSTEEKRIPVRTLVLKAPVHKGDLLRFTEDDPAGAEDLLELLKEFREDRRPRSQPE
jgi:hypothetical protein